MTPCPARETRRAFSLLEVLVAIAILVVLATAVYGFIFRLIASQQAIAERAARDAAVSTVFDRVATTLQTSGVVGPDGEAGLVGSDTSIELVHHAVDIGRGGLKTNPSWRSLRLAWSSASGHITLDDLDNASPREPSIIDVGRLRLRYHNGRSWVSAFDSLEASGLPTAVEVAIWFGAPETDALGSTDADGPEGDDPTPTTLPTEPDRDRAQGDDQEPIDRLPDAIRVFVCPGGASMMAGGGDV